LGRLAVPALLLLVCGGGQAFNPPVDTAGPLKARIEGPQERADSSPFPVSLVLENSSEAPLEGSWSLGLVDGWEAGPSASGEFRLRKKGTQKLDLVIKPSASTHGAHYPIHAFVRFPVGKEEYEAHPIHIVEMKVADRVPPRPVPQKRPAGWKPPESAPFPPEAGARKVPLGRADLGGGKYEVVLWPGKRGLLDSVVGFVDGKHTLFMRGFRLRAGGYQLDDPKSPCDLVEVSEGRTLRGTRFRHRFSSPLGEFTITGELGVRRGVLRARFSMEEAPKPKPWLAAWLEGASPGPFSEKAARIYAGPGNVIEDPQAFTLGFDGHRLSTSFVGLDFTGGMSLVMAVDAVPDFLEVNPEARIYSLVTPHDHELVLIPAPDAWKGVRGWREANGLKAAGGVKNLAGRFTFDIWGGTYASAARGLARSFRYGLTDSMVIWHSWQRWGYDYRLPEIWPPDPGKGTEGEFRALADGCRAAGVLFAPHDNYIDFYPDAEGFTYDKVAFTAEGAPCRAWNNTWHDPAGAQSYRWRPDLVKPWIRGNLKLVREGVAPTAYFIDVWSSIGPYDYWTRDGKFHGRAGTREEWGGYFAWIRDYLGGAPQVSESGHDALVGALDGATANHLRVDAGEKTGAWTVWRIKCARAERVPWFDAAHHDRFVLHGAGYEDRFLAGLDRRDHGVYSDDYTTVEVLTGRPSMVSEPFGREVVRKYWLTHELSRALALGAIETVEFVGGDIAHQRVRWEGGAVVTVNRGTEDWPADGRVLPQYGFHAKAQGRDGPVEAAIERRDGGIVEWVVSPRAVYAGARPLPPAIRVSVDKPAWAGKREFELRFRWEAGIPTGAPLTAFIHFTDEKGAIRFQGDHALPVSTTAWQGTVESAVRVRVPESCRAGESFDLKAGLFDPATGLRQELDGEDDGERRLRLGALKLEGTGGRLADVSWTPARTRPRPGAERMNTGGKVFSFGGVATNGAVRVSFDKGALVVTPLPDQGKAIVRIRASALPWRIRTPSRAEALTEDGRVAATEPLAVEGSEVILALTPGVFAYRLK
jgi:hypothetical protein